ncbi:cytochrome c biogenesis protein CcsA [uncultured Pseudoalteromonas sp.]|uniref:cytochrome C assembly family protein n=1 Tax=uncultured Pseudoalteromonas sp. TaxID=114053 RepID=UPI002591B56C|nr:cytochrome c biogenesis protein CcsA [uncultured Pseudoalteromonas sp.]
MLIISLTIIASLFYVLATSHVLSRLFHRQGPSQKITIILSTVAILAHMLLLVNSVFRVDGQDLSIVNVALLTCWVIVLCVTTVSLKFPATLLLPVVYGFAALLTIASLFIPHHILLHSINVELALVAHISLSLLAYCILIIATLYGVQFYFIDKRLKRKDLAIVHSHLPPLMVVERQLYQLLNLGTVLLSVALITGFVFLDGMFAKEFIHKTILSLIAWAIFATIAVGHVKRGWRGKMVVVSIMMAAFTLTLAYFGSRFIQEVVLNKF